MARKSFFDLNSLWFIPAISVTVGIFLLSTFLSFPIQAEGISYFDKIQHCFAYFVLIISILIALKKTRKLSNSKMLKWVLFCSSYGFSLEMVQYIFFSYRFFEWIDALANVLGVLIGFVTFKLLDRG